MYEFEKIKGKRYAIDVSKSRKLAEDVVRILDKFDYNYTANYSKDYNHISTDDGYSHGSSKWYSEPNYTIISAEDFIRDNSPKMVYTKDNIVGIHFEAGQRKALYKVIEINGEYPCLSEFRSGKWQPKFQSSILPVFLEELNKGMNWKVVNSPIQEDNGEIKVGDEVELFQQRNAGNNHYSSSAIGSRGKVFALNWRFRDLINNYGYIGVEVDGKQKSYHIKDCRKVVVNINKQTIKTKQNEEHSNSIKLQKPNFKISEPTGSRGTGLKSSRSKIIIGSNSSYNQKRPVSCKA